MATASTDATPRRDDMMESLSLKVTMNKLYIRDNGEAPGKGEVYYSLMADSEVIEALSEGQARKVGDGETLILGNSAQVAKRPGEALTVLGDVSERDSGLKGADDSAHFKHVYTAAENWGIGSHMAKLSDGKHLDVTVYYSITKA
jgi:hypothetical protein